MALTDDERHELAILDMATPDTRKFSVPVGVSAGFDFCDLPRYDAFERGLNADWWRLLDIVPAEDMGPVIAKFFSGRMMRIFKITYMGERRLATLRWKRDGKVAVPTKSQAMEQALTALLERYVAMVLSCDCMNWDPETDDEVKAARAALAMEP